MQPASEIKLLYVPELKPDYKNTWKWQNQLEQLKFMQTRIKKTYEKYSYLREDNSIKVLGNVDDLTGINYLMYKNKADKWYFCFVLNKEYVNENTTKLYIATDLIQTHQFNFSIDPSYVNRCHVKRWDSNGLPNMTQTVPEGLEFGDNVQVETTPIYTFKDNYVVVCSNPLGVLPFRTDGGGQGQGDDECSGDWENGILSAEGFRFIKGFEAFAPVHYLDTIAKPPVNTICYGVTEHGEKQIYDNLVKQEPVPEEEGAKVSYDLKNTNYGKKIVDVCKAIGVTKQNQFDALVSLAYNAGTGAVTEKGSLMQLIKQDPNNCEAIKKKWETYYNASQIEGVRLRRIEEAKMFCGEKYEIRPIQIVDNKGKPTGKTVTENNGNGWLPECSKDPTKPSGKTYTARGLVWQYPSTGRVTSLYGMRTHPITGVQKMHHGIDIAGKEGTPIYAPRDGVVEVAGWGGSAGNWVIIHHNSENENLKTVYMHCNEVLCKAGDQVKTGQKIATQGTTGRDQQGNPTSTGVHLHFELRIPPFNRTDTVNPIPSAYVNEIIK